MNKAGNGRLYLTPAQARRAVQSARLWKATHSDGKSIAAQAREVHGCTTETLHRAIKEWVK